MLKSAGVPIPFRKNPFVDPSWFCDPPRVPQFTSTVALNKPSMDLGAFSISLTVKDLQASKAFYEKLGFETSEVFGGDTWAILKNGDHVIGLFQGMFEKNMLTFNPGWDQSAKNVDPFTDVRVLREALKEQGIAIVHDGVTTDEGPGSFLIEDPDGNPILVDQHR